MPSQLTGSARGGTPKRVLHIALAAAGGAGRSTLALIRELALRGIDAAVVLGTSGSEPGLSQEMYEATDGRVLETPLYTWNRKTRVALWKRPLIDLHQAVRTGRGALSARRVAAFAQLQGVDLIHTSTILVTEGGRAARALGLPHVWHLRELVGPGCPFRLPLEGERLGRYLSAQASKVVANSQASARQVAGFLPADLLRVVPNGIDVESFRPDSPRQGGAGITVAMVASLASRSKNHRLFLEAAALVPRTAQVSFRIYGAIPGDAYSRELSSLAERLGLGDHLQFMGHVDDPVEVMREVDVLVHPSAHESFGRVVVEAMAAGRPAIGPRGGGVAEIIDDGVTGYLVEPDNPREMAGRISQLAGDAALRKRLGEAGRQRAERHYSLVACADGIVRVYTEAMANPVGDGDRGGAASTERREGSDIQ